MSPAKNLQGPCSSCGQPITYPAHMVGTYAECPHCGQTTELLLHRPPEEAIIPRKVIVWTLVTVLILMVAFGGAIIALKRAQRWSEQQRAPQQEQTLPR